MLLFIRNVKAKQSIFTLCDVKIENNNKLLLENAYLSRVKIHINGKNNHVTIKGKYLRGELIVIGEGNTIYIDKHIYLANMRIVVRGNKCEIKIGKYVTTGSAYIACMGKNNYVHIGDDCMLAENVDIWATDTHEIIDKNNNILNHSKPIILKDHVWIGKGTAILKGVTIESGSIVGMSSLVTKDIEQCTLYAGSPAKKLKENVTWNRGFIKE